MDDFLVLVALLGMICGAWLHLRLNSYPAHPSKWRRVLGAVLPLAVTLASVLFLVLGLAGRGLR